MRIDELLAVGLDEVLKVRERDARPILGESEFNEELK
jgi:hypothetical protein